MKGVDRAVFAHGRPADGDYRSKVSEKLAKELGVKWEKEALVPRVRRRGMLQQSRFATP